MTSNCRFVLNGNRFIVDTLNDALNSTNDWHYWLRESELEDEKHLRERVLLRRLHDPINKLITNHRPVKKLFMGEEYQPPNEAADDIQWAIFHAIRAAHLNTFAPEISVQNRSTGRPKRQKIGTRDFASLSLCCEDIELLLRDLYGDVDGEAMDSALYAVRVIVEGFAKYARKDLWQEKEDAMDFDYSLGIGVPHGCGISGSEHGRGIRAKANLILRASEVLADPRSFSEYTVEFAKRFNQEGWVCELGCSACPTMTEV
jgi:hypothetical protein